MTRQETVIKITKITRIVGEMKSQLDLDDEIEFEALDSSWMNIGKWAKEICLYMEQVPSSLLANLITNNEFTVPVVNYVQSHKQEIILHTSRLLTVMRTICKRCCHFAKGKKKR